MQFPLLKHCTHLHSNAIIFSNKITQGESIMKKKETVSLTLRVPLSLKVMIELAAHKDGRTVNSYVNKVLEEILNR